MLFRGKYRTGTVRLRRWNYASNGAYFVTICTKNRIHHFGHIADSTMHLTNIGAAARKHWLQIPEYYPFVRLDAFIIMPDHMHGIVMIDHQSGDRPAPAETTRLEAQDLAPLTGPNQPQNKFGPQSRNLGAIIRGYKTAVTKFARKNNVSTVWQPLYYDHVIRNRASFYRIRKYILNNPANWDT